MSKKKGDRSKLTLTDKEWIQQTFTLTGNKAETARRCGFAPQTVAKVLAEAETAPAEVKEARSRVAVELANKVHTKAEDILDSIKDIDIESGRIAIRDNEGKLLGYKYYGPSLMQKATAVGILTDKANVLQTFEKNLLQDTQTGNMLMPDDVQGLVGAIKNQLKELTVLNIKFQDENPGLVRETQDLVAEVERIDAEEAEIAEVTSIDDFDGS